MFENAVDIVSRFTRPVHSIMRTYGSNKVFTGAATLFFVNDHGDAITCRHVVEGLMSADHLTPKYQQFLQERFRLKNDEHYDDNLKQLEAKFDYKSGTLIQMKNNYINCFDRSSSFEYYLHPQYDLAIIRFKGFQKKLYQGFASFIKEESSVKQGKSLCRLGYPFPEFTNYQYNYQSDEIEWTKEGNPYSPTFPLDGIVTRLISQYGRIAGIEMSTPGLRGQSGGPLFDKDGVIYGMQSSTRHLHLGFDLENFEIPGPSPKRITNTPFLHVGQCVHASVIKSFLTEHNVMFQESNPLS
jgi:hypothetical protein